MRTRLTKNNPCMAEKFVLVKLTCRNPMNAYFFYSSNENRFSDNCTKLNIFNKGWRQEATTVSILHPKQVNKCLAMKQGLQSNNLHKWYVNNIPKYFIDEVGQIMIVCLKKKEKKKHNRLEILNKIKLS